MHNARSARVLSGRFELKEPAIYSEVSRNRSPPLDPSLWMKVEAIWLIATPLYTSTKGNRPKASALGAACTLGSQ